MKVLMHHRTQGRGVEAVHLLGIAKGFASLGCEVKIVSPMGVILGTEEEASHSPALSHLAKYSPEVVFEVFEILNNITAVRQLERARQSFPCDILYERFALLNSAGMRKANAWGSKFVVEVNYTTRSWLDLRKRSRIFSHLSRVMEKATFDRADLLLPVSSTLALELEEMGYDQRKILVTPNAADPEYFKPAAPDHQLRRSLGLRNGTVVGYAGGFARWHSLDVLIESAAMLENVGELDLLLVGDGPAMPEIRRLAEKFRSKVNVVLPGRVKHAELRPYLDLMDIVVMAGSNDYGSPMKIFEYMSMGKAVLAPDYPPLRDVMDDGIDGLIFNPKDARLLSGLLKRLMGDRDMVAKLGNKARERVVTEHNWESRVRRINERLKSLATEAGEK